MMVSSHPKPAAKKGGSPWWMKKKVAAGENAASTGPASNAVGAYVRTPVPSPDEMMKVYAVALAEADQAFSRE